MTEEQQIRALIEAWAIAAHGGDLDTILADHAPDIVMFDVPPPFLSRGLDAYMATWEKFWSWSEKPVAFDFQDVMITAGNDVAFATVGGPLVLDTAR